MAALDGLEARAPIRLTIRDTSLTRLPQLRELSGFIKVEKYWRPFLTAAKVL